MSYKVAVAGATGVVGREILKTLAERGFPASEVAALALGRATGSEVSYGEDKVLKVQNLERYDFKGTSLAIFATEAAMSAAQVPRASAAGCFVVDCSGRFHMEHDVPLLVPEVNPHALARAAKRRVVANPESTSIQRAMALKPLHAMARVKRVVVASYQSVSSLGRPAMDELWSQTRAIYVNEMGGSEQFTKQIAFNVIPHVGTFGADGRTSEEANMALEIRKILDPDIQLAATCVRVPVFIGQALAVHAECESPINEAALRETLRESPGIVMLDNHDDGGYVTPVETAGEDAVYISRLRADPSVPHGLAFWCVADNLRKGSALNAVQIAELLHERGLLGR